MAVSTRNLNWLIVLGFNDMLTLVGHFVSDKRSKGIEKVEEEMKVREGKKEEQEWKLRNRIFPLYPYLLQG